MIHTLQSNSIFGYHKTHIVCISVDIYRGSVYSVVSFVAFTCFPIGLLSSYHMSNITPIQTEIIAHSLEKRCDENSQNIYIQNLQ